LPIARLIVALSRLAARCSSGASSSIAEHEDGRVRRGGTDRGVRRPQVPAQRAQIRAREVLIEGFLAVGTGRPGTAADDPGEVLSLPPTLIVTSRTAGSRDGIWLSRTVSVVAP
jgi:hypothetical protein